MKKIRFSKNNLQFFRNYGKIFIVPNRSRRVGMADEADSKSVVGNHVRVQVPLPAVQKSVYTGFFILFKNDYVRAKTSTSSAWILVLPLGMMVLSPLLIMMIRK